MSAPWLISGPDPPAVPLIDMDRSLFDQSRIGESHFSSFVAVIASEYLFQNKAALNCVVLIPDDSVPGGHSAVVRRGQQT